MESPRHLCPSCLVHLSLREPRVADLQSEGIFTRRRGSQGVAVRMFLGWVAAVVNFGDRY